uniref:Uncharacterized protein n=1 Tax=Ananas comosus var. bracteatus TaxID=296719 RepID=A0A6V7PYT9_ANACO|nr:unnamed protein product [Ananas comosus var. bracteatus]
MAPLHKLKVLEQCRIFPTPPPSASRPSSPLTFFDLVFVNFHPVQRLFFYELPALSVSDFLVSELPNLKRSLSLTLHHFYPLAGTLTRDEIAYSEGDFVQLTVAASADDFRDMVGDHPRCVRRFHPLVPELNSRDRLPGAGVSVGTALHHAAADGASYVHFMKSWAAAHATGSTPTPPPLFDRGAVRDRGGCGRRSRRRRRRWRATGGCRRGTSRAGGGRGAGDVRVRARALGALAAAPRAPRGRRRTRWRAGSRGPRGARARARERRGEVEVRVRDRVQGAGGAGDTGAVLRNCLGICAVEARRSELVGEEGAGRGAGDMEGDRGLDDKEEGEG